MGREQNQYLENYWDNLGKGIIQDNIPVNKFGKNPAVSTSTQEDIWDTGGDYVQAATAELINLASSDDTDDKAGQDGMRTVKVYGVTDTFALASELVNLDGTTPVLTTNKYWFIHRMEGTIFGANGVNTGAITAITTATGTPTLATILAAKNKTFMAMFMVPDNYWLWIKHWDSSLRLAAGGSGEYELQSKLLTGTGFLPVELVGVATVAGTKRKTFEPIVGFPPRTIVKVRVIELSAAAMKCSSSFHGELELVPTGFSGPLSI